MVIRRIENEQGWTLSRSDDTRTSGKSNEPLSLKSQMSEAVTGLYLSITIPTMTVRIMDRTIITLFIYAMG